jgi:hypothetical protein
VKRVRIAGHTTAIDCTFHERAGYVTALGADSLRFEIFLVLGVVAGFAALAALALVAGGDFGFD